MHGPSDNPHLLYEMLCAHRSFEMLPTFTLSRAIHAILRTHSMQEHKLLPTAVDAKGKARISFEGEVHDDQSKRMRPPSSGLGSHLGRMHIPDDLPRTDELTRVPGNASGEYDSGNSNPSSEKTRGKSRELLSESFIADDEAIKAAGLGRNGFLPTEDWVSLYA
jgi:hypothetical protein